MMGNSTGRTEEDELEDEILLEQDGRFLWTAKKFFDQDDEEEYTEFEHVFQDPKKLICAKRNISVLRQLRHPNIIKFLSSDESDNQIVYMLAEAVVPLVEVIQEVTPVEVTAGLRDVAKALDFMHNRANLLHNNVCLTSIFVTSGKDWMWKLGCMEAVCPVGKATTQFLESISELREPMAIPPEDATPTSSMTTPPHAGDVYAFGQLILTIYDQFDSSGILPAGLDDFVNNYMMNEDPTQRPTIPEVLCSPHLHNDLTKMAEFFHDITVKTKQETEIFFQDIQPRMLAIPEEVVSRRLLPLLMTPPILSNPDAAPLWQVLLSPCTDDSDEGFLSETLFQNEILPEVLELFSSRDVNIRMMLLNNLENYIDACSDEELVEDILPEVLVGMHDADDAVVAATFKALAVLVTQLGGEVVLGTSRQSIFTDGRPGGESSTSSISQATKQMPAVLWDKGRQLERERKTSPQPAAPGVSKEEKRRQRREEQERLKQKRKAEKQRPKGLKLQASAQSLNHHHGDRSSEEGNEVMEPWEFPSSNPVDKVTPGDDVTCNSMADVTLMNSLATSPHRTAWESEEVNHQNEGWDEFDDNWSDLEVQQEKQEVKTPLQKVISPLQEAGNSLEYTRGTSVSSSTSSSNKGAENVPSTRHALPGKTLSRADEERLERQMLNPEPDLFSDFH